MIKKILSFLSAGERKRLYMLMAVMIVSAVIEVAGIASILPFLSLITSPETIQNNEILNRIYTFLGFQSTNRFLIFAGIVVLVILILSNVLVFLTQWGLARFSWMRNYTISRSLLQKYLYQPYKFYLNQNTNTLGKNILSEVQSVIKGVIVPLLEILARGVVSIFIFAMLVSVEPLLAVSLIVVLGGAYILTYRLIKRRLNIRGKLRFQANTARYKAVDEAFSDIKLLKLRGFEKFFIKRFSKPAAELSKIRSTTEIIGKIPRYITEVIAFGGIIIVVLYLLATGKGFQDFLPLIGLYAFSTYRLLPSIQSIFQGAADIRFHAQALEVLYDDMNSFNNVSDIRSNKNIKTLPFKRELRLVNASFKYEEADNSIIENLNIKIKANTSVAFVGATGAGKTTIANILLGLLRLDSGSMIIDGVEIDDDNIQNWQRNLGYIPQDIYLQDDTVIHNISFGVPDNEIDMEAVMRSARIANIHDFIMEKLPKKYETVVGEKAIRLSGGQRQRIGIARALYHNPEVLVLDEATSALDGATEQEVFEAIENIAKTKTLIIVAHRLTTVQDCDVIHVMENGKIVGSGKYNELLQSNKVFKRIAKVST